MLIVFYHEVLVSQMKEKRPIKEQESLILESGVESQVCQKMSLFEMSKMIFDCKKELIFLNLILNNFVCHWFNNGGPISQFMK